MPRHVNQSEEERRLINRAEPAEDVIEGPWLATREFFHKPEERIWPCKPDDPNKPPRDLIFPFCDVQGDVNQQTRELFGIDKDAGPIHVIIATVPDPVHSRTALTADEQIETIERGLQAAGWEFATQWLPWNDVLDPSEVSVSDRRSERYILRLQDQLPGLVVLRRGPLPKRSNSKQHLTAFSREALFVFIVGETPTAGINGRAFNAAHIFADALTERSDPLGILSPSFSGSFYSLAILLGPKPHLPEKRRKPIYVYGSGATRKDYGERFTLYTGIDFRSGSHNSEDFQNAFCDVLDRYHIAHQDAANLMEDETAFGRSVVASLQTPAGDSEKCSDVPIYHFPREISHLRNAYREAETDTQRNTYNPLPGLEFSLRDPETGEDSIPVYSQQQTPQTQNARVEQLTTEFNRRRFRLVRISASNELDLLFLARMIRVESPDTRVLISDAHVLFIPGAVNAALTGTVFLADYPMTLSMAGFRRRQVFPASSFEGVYNATQFLLKDMRLLEGKDASVLDYGIHPPIWLLTVNRYGFFPLERIRLEHNDAESWMPVLSPPPPPSAICFPPPPRSWMFLDGGLGIGIITFCMLLIKANEPDRPDKPCRRRLPLWLTLKRHYPFFAGRCLSLISVLFVLSASQWILALPLAVAFFRGQFDNKDIRLIAIVMTFLPLGAVAFLAPLVAIRDLVPAWELRAELFQRKHLLNSAGFIVFFAAYTGLLWAWGYCACLDSANSRSEYFDIRALEIYSGSSPAAPILILLSAFVFVAVSHYRRYSLAAMNQPELPKEPGDRQYISVHSAEVYCQIVKPMDLMSKSGRVPVAWVLGGLLFVFMLLGRHAYFSVFEGWTYNWLLVITEGAVLALLALGCIHIVRLWSRFAELLADFESTIYMDAIARVTRSWPRRPIWASGKFFRNPAFERQSLVALHNRRVNGKEAEEKKFELFRAAVNSMREACAKHEPFDRVFSKTRRYYDLCKQFAEELLRDVLYPYWISRAVTGRCTGKSAAAQSDEPESIRAAADFIVLHLARYFVFVAMQVQQIAWALSIIMVILLVGCNAYTPQAPQAIGRFMALCFVVIGFFVVRVFAGMERNPILSRITGTRPGKLNWEFYTQIAALGILPLIGVLAHLFPAIGSFLSSWVAPSVESIN